jgi:hypothetical protein
MCLGIMPGAAVGIRYRLDEFVNIGAAVKVGNIRAFEDV